MNFKNYVLIFFIFSFTIISESKNLDISIFPENEVYLMNELPEGGIRLTITDYAHTYIKGNEYSNINILSKNPDNYLKIKNDSFVYDIYQRGSKDTYILEKKYISKNQKSEEYLQISDRELKLKIKEYILSIREKFILLKYLKMSNESDVEIYTPTFQGMGFPTSTLSKYLIISDENTGASYYFDLKSEKVQFLINKIKEKDISFTEDMLRKKAQTLKYLKCIPKYDRKYCSKDTVTYHLLLNTALSNIQDELEVDLLRLIELLDLQL